MESINEVKKIIMNQVNKGYIKAPNANFIGYQKNFFVTTEDIRGYLDLVDLTNKNKALTVLSSGDQAFNLLNKGIKNIDTFDINYFTEYHVFGLKRTMILKYDYETYLNVCNIFFHKYSSLEKINEIIFDLIPYMDLKYRVFWKQIIDYSNNIQKDKDIKFNLVRLLFYNLVNNNYNNYLLNKEEYNKLKYNLNKVNMSFKAANANDLSNHFKDRYDVILMSNILDYFYDFLGENWNIDRYLKKINKLKREDSVVFLHYIYNYCSNNNFIRDNLIWGIEKDNIKGYKVLKLKSNNEKSDGVLISKG